MERRKKRVTCLILSCFTLLLNISIAKAEALPDVMAGSATIADCVMSYYAMAGCAVANTDWINSLYNSLGSSFGTIYDFAENGMLTINEDGTWQATTALTNAIENSSAYTSLGLDQVFNVSAAEAAAAGGVAASGAGTLAGAVGGVASTGLLTVAAGVTAAYWGGIAVGTIAAHLLGLYDKNIYNGVEIDQEENFIKNSQDGYGIAISSGGNQYYTNKTGYTVNGRTFGLTYPSETGVFYNIYVQNKNATSLIVNYTNLYGNGTTGTGNVSLDRGIGDLGYVYRPNSATTFNTYCKPVNYHFQSGTDASNFIEGLKNGTQTLNIKSPDLIGRNGNLSGDYSENNGYTVPDLLPSIDPSVQAGVPLTQTDWLNFANSAHQNDSTGALPDNSALFDSLIDSIVRAIPNPGPNPNPNPNPNPDPYTPPVVTPVPDPDYDPVPDNPDQPDYESEKQKQTEPIPDEVPTGAPWTTDGLLEKFPFCIPKDMIDMVKQFSTGSRQAPYINWRFNPPGTPVDYTFNLDLSDFEDAATLIRMLELAAFIVGLAFATRYIIGAT